MIVLEGVSHDNRDGLRRTRILEEASTVFPAGRGVALLGRNGAGKSTLLKLISGARRPDRGRIWRRGTISWPVGFSGSFHPDMTGVQNVRFLARINGVDPDALVDFVEGFARLGPHMRRAYRTYSSGMRSRLSMGASMGIGFDTYLIDEVTSVGDAAFRQVAEDTLAHRLKESGAIIVSHSDETIRRLCDCGVVLHGRKLHYHDDVESALAHHHEAMARGLS